MAIGTSGETIYTRTVKTLIRRIHDATPVRDSFYEDAADYFKQIPKNQAYEAEVQAKIDKAQDTIRKTSRKPVIQDLEDQIKSWRLELKHFHQKLEDERIKRRNKLLQICFDILELLEGANFLEENTKAAKLLGTIFMIQPDEGKRRLASSQRAKHLYKSCVSLRLLDRLLSAGLIKDSYISERSNALFSADADAEVKQRYRDEIKIPLIMAALLQDVGRMHPDALTIVHGEHRNQYEFRTLSAEERAHLLHLSYTQSLLFTRDAIGAGKYIGNSRQERDEFNLREEQKLKFILRMMKNAINGKSDIGELIKVPQVYTSAVLSTKEQHKLAQVPLVMMILKQGAETGKYSKATVAAMLSVLGIFPQGFGIAYVPQDNQEYDKYEYAIVTGLYPPKFDEPVCKRVTRNLQYYPNGHDVTISRQQNLFFPAARKQLEKISKERLIEIFEKLCFDAEERKNQDLIPRCWHPYHYFADEKHQQLWSKSTIDNQ